MSISLQFLTSYLDKDFPTAGPEVIKVTALTWNRDSHDLFDYEAPQLSCQSFEFTDRAVDLFRKGNEVMSIIQGDILPPECEYIGTLLRDKMSGNFILEQHDIPSSKKIWSVVKDNWPEGVPLSEGDVVKLGRFKLRVRQICTGLPSCDSDDKTSCSSLNETMHPGYILEPKQLPDLTLGPRPVIPSISEEDALVDPQIKSLQCRICLSEGPTENDPLVCPCECSGSIRYVHVHCLGHWLCGRLGLENHDGPVYFYRPLACELCHCRYPSYYKLRKELHPLASLPPTREPFIVFENIGGLQLASPWNCDSSNTFPDGLHVVRFKGQQSLKLGRGNECEMRISDVSISRLHAMLSLAEDGSVLLQDHKSKFGTLLDTGRMDKRLVIPNDSPLSVQSGRTLLSFSVLAVVGSDQDTVNDTDMIDDDADLVVDDDIYQNSLLHRPNTT